ncbi:RNA polymerase sigma factor [Nonomuraea sp. NPDC050394]|uniref:RNA polymerase sigma factor n=1 Tax=Nonomuraea sp. NPDC050394 TaxID=3364363 RepID=UPI0037B7C8BE
MSEASPADSAIIARSRQEPEVFAEIFRRHAPEIKRFVIRRLGLDIAEDVVAETFLAAFRQRGRYDLARHDALPWLYGIATNLIGRHQRTEARQLNLLARTGVDPVTEPFTARSDERLSAQAVQRSLAAALAALPAGHRDVLLLVTWGRLSYTEAAEALGIRVGTVRSRVSRARAKIREELGGTDPTALDVEEVRHG